jgi:hypothetical protein
MNKVYLNQYLSIVLSIVFLVLVAMNANTLLALYEISVSEIGIQQKVSENPQFKMEFAQSSASSLIYLIVSLYFAVLVVKDFPLIEYGKDSRSKKLESDESKEN